MPDRYSYLRVYAIGRDREVSVELSPVVAEALDSALALAASPGPPKSGQSPFMAGSRRRWRPWRRP